MFKKLLTILSISILAFWLSGCGKNNTTQASENIKTITAGYISYAPGFIVDPNTKELSGIFYEVLEEIAKRNDFKIDYKEEVTRATMIETLNTNRVNIIANPVWPTAEREANSDFSDAVYWSPVWAYVRYDDDRFESLDQLNDPSVRISLVDWEAAHSLSQELFPEATIVSHSHSVDQIQMLLEVQTNKWDVTFREPINAHEYMLNNPWKLKNIAEWLNAVKSRSNSFMIKQWNAELQTLLNEWIREMQLDWTLDKIIDKYEPFTNAVTRLKPWQL